MSAHCLNYTSAVYPLKDIAEATNYVRTTLDAAMAGKAIAVKGSKPYGCSVKYK